jgi:hypothetical protein
MKSELIQRTVESKPALKSRTIRLPVDLDKAFVQIAKTEGEKYNALVIAAMREYARIYHQERMVRGADKEGTVE